MEFFSTTEIELYFSVVGDKNFLFRLKFCLKEKFSGAKSCKFNTFLSYDTPKAIC